MTKFILGSCLIISLFCVNISAAQTPDEIKAMDTNKDGKISKEEYLDNCSKKFDALDTNKDGSLEKSELQKRDTSPKNREAAIKEMMKKMPSTNQQPAK